MLDQLGQLAATAAALAAHPQLILIRLILTDPRAALEWGAVPLVWWWAARRAAALL